MSINYAQLADFLRNELQAFTQNLTQGITEERHQFLTERLWAAIQRVEMDAYAPPEEQWSALSETQRWGYLRLESYLGTALHELRRSQRVIWRGPHKATAPNDSQATAYHAQA